MDEMKSSTENAAPAAKVALRKKAPFTCRAVGVDGKTLIHYTHPLAVTDGDLCPLHEAERKARNAKAHLPIKRDEPAPSGRFFTDAEWAERKSKGAIWPI